MTWRGSTAFSSQNVGAWVAQRRGSKSPNTESTTQETLFVGGLFRIASANQEVQLGKSMTSPEAFCLSAAFARTSTKR